MLDAQLGVVPGDTGVHQAQVAVGPAAKQRHRGHQVIGVLAAVALSRPRPGDQQPRVAGEAPPGVARQVAGGQADLPALDGRAADHAGADPERAGGHVGYALEPHPYRADKGVALFLGVVPGQVGEFDAQALRVHIETVVVALGELDDEIIRHQGAALRHDGGAVVHLPLYGASHLDGLQLRPEGPGGGTLDHSFTAALEALQNSQRAPSLPVSSPDRIRGAGALGVVLTYSLPRAGGGTADAHGLGPCVRKDVRVQIPPRPRVGLLYSLAGWPASLFARSAGPGGRPPGTPRVALSLLGWPAVGQLL